MIYFNFKIMIFSIIIYILLLLYFFKKKKKTFFYFFFTLFYIYINIVIKYTQFPIFNDPTQRSIIGTMRIGRDINLIPLRDALNMTSIYNIILTVPFGFLLPFLTNISGTKIIITGAFFSFLLESAQLFAGIVCGYTFRIVDINDIIFNTLGAAVGCFFFLLFVKIVKLLYKDTHQNKFITYILNVSAYH